MPTLHEIQRAFARSLLRGRDSGIEDSIVADDFSAAERLRVYRNSCRSVVVEVLRITFPVVDQLVGRDFFDLAAEQFCSGRPPVSGYLNDFGGAFADFLSVLPEAAATPGYLPDVARFEWALNRAANADDAPTLELASLAAVDPEQHERLRFVPHPSVQLLDLQYPADTIADAVVAGDDDAMAAVDLADGPVRLAVNRGPNGVAARRLSPSGYAFARRLFGGESLSGALQAAETDGATHLADHFVNGCLSGFYSESERRDG
jgi:hypothetical protein